MDAAFRADSREIILAEPAPTEWKTDFIFRKGKLEVKEQRRDG
jgi:hypothetical protein